MRPAARGLALVVLLVSSGLLVLPGSGGATAQSAGGGTDDLLAEAERALAAGELHRAVLLAGEAAGDAPARGSAILARALGRLGALPRAEAAARRALEASSSPRHAMLLAWTQRRQEDLDAAAATLDQALGRSPDDPEEESALRRELALVHLDRGAAEEALAVLEGGSSPPDPGVLGLTLAALPDRAADAVEPLRQALASTGQSRDADATDATVVPASALRRELGGVLLSLDRAEEALPPLQAAWAEESSTDLAYRLAEAHRRLGHDQDAREALDHFQRLRQEEDRLDTRRREVGTRLNEAQRLAGENRLQPALELVEEIRDEHPSSYSAHALAAKILFSLGRANEAVEAIRRARELEPGLVEFHYLEGLFLRTLGRDPEALEALVRAIALDPGLAEAHALLGGVLLDLDRPRRALQHLDRAVELGAGGEQIERAREIARSRLESPP